MARFSRELWSGKVLYPLAALLLIGALVGLSRCPAASPMASDFSLPVVTPDGRSGPDRLRLADQRGKVVLLDFWATWCGPCARTTPMLVRLARRFRERGLVVWGVNVDQYGPEAVPMFMRRFRVDYPVVYDSGAVSEQYNVRALPTVVLIDRQGRIRKVHTGAAGEDDLADEIEALL